VSRGGTTPVHWWCRRHVTTRIGRHHPANVSGRRTTSHPRPARPPTNVHRRVPHLRVPPTAGPFPDAFDRSVSSTTTPDSLRAVRFTGNSVCVPVRLFPRFSPAGRQQNR
jgi:hypothetical protein